MKISQHRNNTEHVEQLLFRKMDKYVTKYVGKMSSQSQVKSKSSTRNIVIQFFKETNKHMHAGNILLLASLHKHGIVVTKKYGKMYGVL